MAAATTPITNGSARAVIKRINQYGHGLTVDALSLFGQRFDLQRGAGFGRRGRVFDLQALSLFTHTVAGGLLHALFVWPRLLRRVPGVRFNLLPGPRRRLLFDLRQAIA